MLQQSKNERSKIRKRYSYTLFSTSKYHVTYTMKLEKQKRTKINPEWTIITQQLYTFAYSETNLAFRFQKKIPNFK